MLVPRDVPLLDLFFCRCHCLTFFYCVCTTRESYHSVTSTIGVRCNKDRKKHSARVIRVQNKLPSSQSIVDKRDESIPDNNVTPTSSVKSKQKTLHPACPHTTAHCGLLHPTCALFLLGGKTEDCAPQMDDSRTASFPPCRELAVSSSALQYEPPGSAQIHSEFRECGINGTGRSNSVGSSFGQYY